MKNMLRGTPVVCAVSDKYIICVPVNRKVLMSVTVGGREYFCHSNGIRRSDVSVQKFTVPMKELDSARSYTVKYEAVITRTPKLCEKEAPVSLTFDFKPLTKKTGINIYHISDSHGAKAAAVRAGRFFKGDLDLLILNGDLASQTSTKSDLLISLDIASAVTGGRIPCIISRGNHDLRGKCAEQLEDYLPTDNGRTYYSVQLGSLWFLLLDCGEDKVDSHKEYSGTVCCHSFRLDQSEFLEALSLRAKKEYGASGIKHRIIISHVPFNMDNTDECKGERPFNIERPLYAEWCRFIREQIKPDFMLSGHTHTYEIIPAGSPADKKNIGTDTILGGAPVKTDGKITGVIGCAITLSTAKAYIRFTDDKNKVLSDCQVNSK